MYDIIQKHTHETVNYEKKDDEDDDIVPNSTLDVIQNSRLL